MRPVLTAEQMREADRLTTEECGIPSILLMEKASSAVADAVAAEFGFLEGLSVGVFCGKGNNGGDGAAAARHLWSMGAEVRVFLFGEVEETKGDARTNFRIARELSGKKSEAGGTLEFAEITDLENWSDALGREIAGCDIAIDALFGTGLTRPVEGGLAKIVGALKRHESGRPFVVSVDLPSGLDADRNEPIGIHAEADLTVTFTAPKLANVMAPSSRANGDLAVAEIGTPAAIVEGTGPTLFVSEDSDVARWLEKTAFSDSSYKKTRGTLLIVAGSRKFSGAAVLAGNAASETGVGMVTVATAESVLTPVSERVIPEVITASLQETEAGYVSAQAYGEFEKLAGSIDAVAIGCGLGSEDESTREFVRRVIEGRSFPVVADADALNSIAPLEIRGSDDFPLVLTPHQGEFLRLLGTDDASVLDDRIGAAASFASKFHVVLVLKGEKTIVAAPDGRAVVISTGNPGLGKAGNGDNLTGIIAGFVAQARKLGVGMFETVVAAVHLAGLAGDIASGEFGQHSMLASDVRRAIPAAIRIVEEGVD